MTRLTVRLLGEFAASIDGTEIEFATDKVRGLLAFLAAEAEIAHPRTQLATLLWGDWDDKGAKANLRKSLFRLKKGLGDSAEILLTITRSSVQFHAAHAEIDLQQFTQLAQNDDIASLTIAAAHYQGGFLTGLAVEDAPEFNEWLTVQREALHQQYLALLYQLGELHLAQGDFAEAQRFAQEQLALESWREGAHRQMMRVFEAQGKRAEALAQYDNCRTVLEEELGVAVSAETEQLAAAIRGEQLLTTHLHQFLAPQTRFVGRQADINRVLAHLNTPSTRLVTLIGTGGVGKTRLAVETVMRSVGNRAAYFLPLSTITTQDGIWQLLAERLEIKSDSRRLHDEVCIFLRERAPLLVFDNYEQLLPTTSCIERLLADAPDVQILVTSRAPLNLRAEWRLPLEGLDVPAVDAVAIADYSAVELLLTTGRQVQPDFAISAENSPHLIRICRALAGMPLALEMAGSWLNLFTPELLADEIERNLDFLVATRSDMPERHRSLRAIFDYAQAQLHAAERQLLTQLTVFQGSFSLKATLAILAPSPIVLNKLIDHALLQRQSDNRFGLHPVLRSFLSGELSAEIHRKHATYYLEHIAATTTANIAETVNDISTDLANVRSAWGWAVSAQADDLLANALDGLLAYYEFRGSYAEGRTQFAVAAMALPPSDLVNRLRLAEAICLQQQGDLEGAIALVQTTLQANATDLPALMRLAHLYEQRADYEDALSVAQQAMTLADPHSADAATIWNILGLIYRRLGSLEQRLEAYRHALAINEVLGEVAGSAECHNMIGLIYRDKGQYDEGITHLEQAITIAKQQEHHANLARFLNNLGRIYASQHKLAPAKRSFEEALAIAQKLNHKQRIAICTGNLGTIANQTHNYPTAIAYYKQAISLAAQLGDKSSQSVYLGNMGGAMVNMGQYAAAIDCFERACAFARMTNESREIGRELAYIGDTYRYQHQFAKSLPFFEESIPHLRQVDGIYFLCWALISYAESLFEVGRFEEAQQANLEGGAMANAAGRETYVLVSELVAARLNARADKAAAISQLRLLREQAHDLEHIAEIDYAIWRITGDSADFATAEKSMERLYAATKWAWFRSRLQPTKTESSSPHAP